MTSISDADEVYISTRWENQFKYMAQQDIDKKVATGSAIQVRAGGRNDNSMVLREKYGEEMGHESVISRQKRIKEQVPKWHAPWKLVRVINGHGGWVRSVVVDKVDNEWFATSSNDKTIKIWNLASGKLKITLTGHEMTVRDLAISDRHPYMFSVSEDKTVKCWDLEKNTAIRNYHGHLSGVHTVDIHPTLDIIATAGRDSVVRLWDIRTRLPIMVLPGHKGPITKVHCLPVDPQIVSSSVDASIRLWDIVAGKAMKVLTHHQRTVRDIAFHPSEFSMASASTNDIRAWRLPLGELLTNYESNDLDVINTLSVNQDDVLFAGGDNGALSFFDYKSGHKYQSMVTKELPGSLESERGILCSSFDGTGLRLITGETDKSIKIWKQDETATPESHPGLEWKPSIDLQKL
ncbi:Pre-mRNA-splicing factor PRP46 [Nakaseomyces bracarensis]|uniref:Pre-mRNA-splicing factor PRP46 n=1 Tax=Nakaseomyces bracarensis TaxID=273131 RepID=A0ABR4NTZ8_9SACH